MKKRNFQINKASGERERFSQAKLARSLMRAGFTSKNAYAVAAKVGSKVKPHTDTQCVYQTTVKVANQQDPILATRYKLKKAIMDLGPTGFPFEKYIGAVLSHYGYQTQVNQIIHGQCISHEVDVVAEKGDKHIMIECKYHNRRGTKTGSKEALYTHARFLDVEKKWRSSSADRHRLHEPWLVTNTKATSKAIKYSKCAGMCVIAWQYPKKNNLQQIIEDKALYPISILPDLKKDQARVLLENNIVLIHDLFDSSRMSRLLKQARIGQSQYKNLLTHARSLCQSCGVEVK